MGKVYVFHANLLEARSSEKAANVSPKKGHLIGRIAKHAFDKGYLFRNHYLRVEHVGFRKGQSSATSENLRHLLNNLRRIHVLQVSAANYSVEPAQ